MDTRSTQRLTTVRWALILIWLGVVLGLHNLGWLEGVRLDGMALASLGIGFIVVGEGLVSLARPAYRRPVTGHFVIGILLLALGLGDLVGWRLVWPLTIIAVGLLLLARAIASRWIKP